MLKSQVEVVHCREKEKGWLERQEVEGKPRTVLTATKGAESFQKKCGNVHSRGSWLSW